MEVNLQVAVKSRLMARVVSMLCNVRIYELWQLTMNTVCFVSWKRRKSRVRWRHSTPVFTAARRPCMQRMQRTRGEWPTHRARLVHLGFQRTSGTTSGVQSDRWRKRSSSQSSVCASRRRRENDRWTMWSTQVTGDNSTTSTWRPNSQQTTAHARKSPQDGTWPNKGAAEPSAIGRSRAKWPE